MGSYNSALACVNMTRNEAIQTIMSGQPLNVVYLKYTDNRGFRSEWYSGSNICYNPETDELLVNEEEFWNANNELEAAGGDS